MRDAPAQRSTRHEPVRVWDPLQRLVHWSLAAAVGVSWWAGEARLSLHLWAGYTTLALVVVRVAWGWAGSAHARFASFVRGPRAVQAYAGRLLRGQAPRLLGHNPLGGWMVLALLGCLAVVCVSGILYTTDRFWGLAWLEHTHRISAWTLVALIALHLCGVAFMSWRHRENLVGAMWSGRKRPERPPPGG
ncbi:cytochrome b/b6 domain-containing protein [Variovorax sp. ZT4R33]|uniref:cytochrome b/b6 domain-containing protein n=1 Tax=Variovorax sp. ZT4R33 TaxID=3443743 RepID=UPI003F45FB0C